MRFDAYDQAEALARHMASPGNRLLVVLGAELWCQRCRSLRPRFDAMAAHDSAAWVWLDIEADAGLLGGYVPDNLPQLLVYSGGVLLHFVTGPAGEEDLRQALALGPGATACEQADPGIAARLQKSDWASQ